MTCLLCGQDTRTLVCETCEKTAQRIEVPARYICRGYYALGNMSLIPLAIGRKRVRFTDCYNLLYTQLSEFDAAQIEKIRDAIGRSK